MPCAALMPRDERRNGDYQMPALEPLRTSAPPLLWRATGRTPVGTCSHDVHRASVTLRFCAANLLRSVPPACGMDSLMAICDGSWRREHDCIRHTPPTCPWQHRHVSARHSKPPAFCTMLAGWGTSLGNGSTLLPCLSVSLRHVLAMTADVCVGWTWQVDTARTFTNSGTYSAWQVGQVACGA